jgi:hypothetical protein
VTKRFLIASEQMTPTQIRALKNALQGKGWWKWIPGFWLVKDPTDTLTVSSLRETIKALPYPGNFLVMEIEPKGWASVSRKDARGRSMTDWLKVTWKSD